MNHPPAGPVTVRSLDTGAVLRIEPAHQTKQRSKTGKDRGGWWPLPAPFLTACTLCGQLIHPGQSAWQRGVDYRCARCQP